jgi:phasin family protein
MEFKSMNTDIFAPLTQQSKRFMAPVRKLNDLAMAHTERVIAFQTASLQKYAKLGIAHWKAAAAVDDLESLSQHLWSQTERTAKVGQQVMADTKQGYQLIADFF